jgi:hypothetical protein
MDAYDALPPAVRAAVGSCLAPWSVEMIAGWVAAGWSEQRILDELARLERQQHLGAVAAGVVPAVPGGNGFLLTAKRARPVRIRRALPSRNT